MSSEICDAFCFINLDTKLCLGQAKILADKGPRTLQWKIVRIFVRIFGTTWLLIDSNMARIGSNKNESKTQTRIPFFSTLYESITLYMPFLVTV